MPLALHSAFHSGSTFSLTIQTFKSKTLTTNILKTISTTKTLSAQMPKCLTVQKSQILKSKNSLTSFNTNLANAQVPKCLTNKNAKIIIYS